MADFTLTETDFSTGTLTDVVLLYHGELRIGYLTEDFESETLTLPFTGDWARSNVRASGGAWSFKAAPIGHGGITAAELTIECGGVEFDYFVSCQSYYDRFRFFIDGSEYFNRSGIMSEWAAKYDTQSYRSHTFRWEYSKNADTTAGEDSVWIDNVSVFRRLPEGTRLAPEIDLSGLLSIDASMISWTADEPTGTAVAVETNLSFDGGATWAGWQACTNGGPIPGLAGQDPLNAVLLHRQTLTTTDPAVSPTLSALTIEIDDGNTMVIRAVPAVIGYASSPAVVKIAGAPAAPIAYAVPADLIQTLYALPAVIGYGSTPDFRTFALTVDNGFLSYRLALTGTPSIDLPFTNLQSRLRDATPSYLRVTVPGIEAAEAIAARASGELVLYMRLTSIDCAFFQEEEIARVALEEIIVHEGVSSKSIELLGHKIAAGNPKTVRLSGISYKKTQGADITVRCVTPDFYLRPGDTVIEGAGGATFTAGLISLMISEDGTATMEVTSRRD